MPARPGSGAQAWTQRERRATLAAFRCCCGGVGRDGPSAGFCACCITCLINAPGGCAGFTPPCQRDADIARRAVCGSVRGDTETERRHRRAAPGAGIARLWGVTVAVVALLALLWCPARAARAARAGRPAAAGRMLRLRGGGADMMQVANSAGQKKLGLGGKSQESEGPTVGPTVRSKDDGVGGSSLTLPSSYVPFAVSEGPLAETMRLVAVQERALLLQASRCRVAMTRMDFLQKIMAARPLQVFFRRQSERLCLMAPRIRGSVVWVWVWVVCPGC